MLVTMPLRASRLYGCCLDSFKAFDNSELVYGFDHLTRLKCAQRKFHKFIIQWKHVIDNMGGVQYTGEALRDIFYRKTEVTRVET